MIEKGEPMVIHKDKGVITFILMEWPGCPDDCQCSSCEIERALDDDADMYFYDRD